VDKQTIEMPKLHMRAEVNASSFNPETRTVEVVFATDTEVTRSGWVSSWKEILSMDPANIRMNRINSGRAPLLNSHNAWDLADQLGVIESGRIENGKGVAVVRFSSRDDVAPILKDVQDGIICNISVGYRVHQWDETTDGDGNTVTRTATDWEPYEISLVPIPADFNSYVRKEERQEVNPCIVVRRDGAQVIEERKDPMDKDNKPPVTAQPDLDAVRKEAADAAVRAFQVRATEIRGIAKTAKWSEQETQTYIDGALSVDEVRKAALEKLAASSEEQQITAARGTGVVGEDRKRSVFMSALQNAIEHRANPAVELTKDGRDFRGMSLVEMARASVEQTGVSTRGMSRAEIVGHALNKPIDGRALHTTSDFPIILGNTVNRTLRGAYEETAATYGPIVRETTTRDFRPVTKAQLGEAPNLAKVEESGEFTRGTLGEAKESYQLATYGKVVGITRQMIINDDLDAFSRIPAALGAQAKNLISDLVWSIFIKNYVMGDGKTIFHADHGNLLTNNALDVTGLSKARQAMRKQKGVDGKTRITVSPNYLITGTALETQGQSILANITPATAQNVNVFSGSLKQIVEPRLDDIASNADLTWFLAATGMSELIDLAYLEGEVGPQYETRIGFDVDGVETKIRLDVVAAPLDFRPFLKSVGA
jgi:Caudovirus prohead serine protease/Mu-like prophage major head subunit gpT